MFCDFFCHYAIQQRYSGPVRPNCLLSCFPALFELCAEEPEPEVRVRSDPLKFPGFGNAEQNFEPFTQQPQGRDKNNVNKKEDHLARFK